jgi:hypothetical protein
MISFSPLHMRRWFPASLIVLSLTSSSEVVSFDISAHRINELQKHNIAANVISALRCFALPSGNCRRLMVPPLEPVGPILLVPQAEILQSGSFVSRMKPARN